ncbi:hypothetical protein NE848_05680 [Gramella jeungdoensis]|uniref:NIPSNAP domain-containing protein n=1 Tax=Gramella jeungdoensis TaxID=708091 RepID=A0ABT0Z233_9FLAO|nr:hypothetical protein [Gramella jeungdoensis]MCM8568859.1 hypothetical protein [Gramella jeungdoensis]
MRTIRTILGLLFLFCSIHLVTAQEMTAKKYENPNWVQMVYIKFKPMKKDAAMGIIQEYFAKADKNAGIEEPTVYHFATGDHDMLVVWEMEEGIETLNYEMTPNDAKWMNEMAKLAGGPDKAMAKMDEFFTYVDLWESSIARKE